MRQLSRPTVAAGIVVGVLAVSTSAILARVAMGAQPGITTAPDGHASALAVAFWRVAIGALTLAPFGVRAARRRASTTPGPSRHHGLLAIAGLALAAHFALFQGSLALTTVASAVTLATMSPVVVALGGHWLLHEPTGRRTWIGLLVTIVGAVTIGAADLGATDHGARALVGDLLAFTSAIAIAGYLLVGRRARRDIPATTYSAIVYGWAALALLAVCVATGVELVDYDPVTWASIAGIVVGPQLLGHTVFNALLSTLPAPVVSTVILAEPVGAGLLAWLVLTEVPSPMFALGAPIVLVGVAIATLRRRPPIPADEIMAPDG